MLAAGLGGCAFVGGHLPKGAAAGPSNRWLYPVETIDGGLTGNAVVGNPVTQLARPIAVAERDHELYIVDANEELLYRYDTVSHRMTVVKDLRAIATAGPRPFMSVNPGTRPENEIQGGKAIDITAVYVARDHSYYLADGLGHRVLHFTPGGRLIQAYKDALNLGRPVAIDVDETTGDVYVADGLFDHILIFNSAGQLWRMLGDRGLEEGQFLNVTAMTRGPEGIYVTARLGLRGQVLEPEEGHFRYAFEDNTLVFPNGIAVDPDGRAYVSDFFDNSIKIFEHGKLMTTVGGTGGGPGRFKGIAGLTLGDGFLYVADSLNGRIQVFRIAAGASPATGQ